MSASLSLHAGRCRSFLAVYLAASTSLSTSLSLHAGRLRRPAELSRIEDAGPRPIWSETFFKHLRTWELENDFNLLCDPPGGFVSGLSRLQGPCKLVVSGGVTRGRVARGVMWRRHRGSDVPKRKRRNNPKRDQEWGMATGREASLHFGGLTSQQTRNGWPRGKKNQITRAPSGWRRPSSLESPHAIKADSDAKRVV